MEGGGGPVIGQRGIRLDGRLEDPECAIVTGHGLGPRLGVELRSVEEQEVDHGRHLAQHRHPLLDHRGHGREDPIVERLVGPRRGVTSQPRSAHLDERVHGQGADVLAVHVGELGHVEERRGVVDVVEGEPLGHLRGREDLGLVVGRAPAQQTEVVDERLRQEALVAVGLDSDRVLALGQLLAGLVDQHREVGEDRKRRGRSTDRADGSIRGPPDPGQGFPQEDAPGSGRKQVLAPDDVGDGHVDVVDHVGQHE